MGVRKESAGAPRKGPLQGHAVHESIRLRERLREITRRNVELKRELAELVEASRRLRRTVKTTLGDDAGGHARR